MWFFNSDLNKQAQALKVTFSRARKSYHSQTYFNNITKLSVSEIEFLSSHFSEKWSVIYKSRKSDANKCGFSSLRTKLQ